MPRARPDGSFECPNATRSRCRSMIGSSSSFIRGEGRSSVFGIRYSERLPTFVLGKTIVLRRSKVEGRRSKVEGRKSKVEGRRSKVESRKSKVEGRKSKVESRRSKVE